MKLPYVPSLSQVSCAWDTRLVSDVPGHLNESGNEGRREKAQIDLFHARFQSLDVPNKQGLGSNQVN